MVPDISITSLVDLARQAGGAILSIYVTDFSAEKKSDNSPLTAADMASHQAILLGLSKLAPDIPILSEESSDIPFETRRSWSRYWLVDPLDGTKEFIKRNGEFTVNIALIEDQVPVIGVIHVPVAGVSYFAIKGRGAWRQEAGSDPEEIHVARHCGNPVRVAGSRSHADAYLNQYLEKLGDHEMVSMGSSLKLCLVAEGQADIYPRLGPTAEWDTAAAQAIVEAAGGQVTDTRMQPLRYDTKDSLLNPHFLVFGDQSVDWSSYLPDDYPSDQ